MAEVFVETGRLVLRRFEAGDADLVTGLDSDPEVMRFLTGGRPTPREQVAATVLPRMIASYDRYDGYGIWAAEERASGAFAGWFHLRPPSEAPDGALEVLELGYRLRRAVWGRGYATEGSLALVATAFADPRVHRVIARTMAVNSASRRVMEKAGLRFARSYHESWTDPIPGAEHGEVEYALDRAGLPTP
jgi:RimJ/RimL family protein N-acetyltransferase